MQARNPCSTRSQNRQVTRLRDCCFRSRSVCESQRSEFANFTAECGFDPSKFAAYLIGFGAALMRPASRQIAQKLAFLHAYMTKCMTHANAILLTRLRVVYFVCMNSLN